MVPCIGSTHAGKSSHPPERATIFRLQELRQRIAPWGIWGLA